MKAEIRQPLRSGAQSGNDVMKKWLRQSALSLYRAFGSPGSGTVAVIIIASLLWLIALTSFSHH